MHTTLSHVRGREKGETGTRGISQQAQKRVEPGNTMAGLSREGYLGEQPSPWAGEFGVRGRCTSKGDPVTERDWGCRENLATRSTLIH